MAVIKGHNGSLHDSNGDTVGELTGFSLTIDQNTEEHSAFGSEWINATATTKGWSVEGSGMYDPDDTYQNAIVEDIISGDSSYSIECRPQGSTVGNVKYTGTVIFGDVNIEASAEGVVAFSFTSRGNGTLTKGTV
jgi:hypothetical protein